MTRLTGRWEQVLAVMVMLLVVVVVVGLGDALLYPRFTRAERSEVLAHA